MRHDKILVLGLFLLNSLQLHAAHIAKFDTKPADAVYISPANVNDIERCLIRLDGAGGVPHVYSQPDRANQRLIIWINDNNDASARVDLRSETAGTQLTVWRAMQKNRKEFEICAPNQKISEVIIVVEL